MDRSVGPTVTCQKPSIRERQPGCPLVSSTMPLAPRSRSGAWRFLWRYLAVREAVVVELIAAESNGAYNRKIRHRFAYHRLP